MSLDRSIVKSAAGLFDLNSMFRKSISRLTVDECTIYWSVIDLLEKRVLKGRKAELRKRLLDLAKTMGVVDKTGNKVLKLGDIQAEIRRGMRAGKISYSIEAAKEYVNSHSEKDPEVARLIHNVPTVDENVLVALYEMGKMSQKEFDSIAVAGKDVEVLTVKHPKDISGLLEDL